MKLLYIVNARIPSEKAHSYQVIKMCEEFAMAGNEVELWAPTRNNLIKKNIFEYYGVKNIFKFKLIKSFDFLQYDKILGKTALYLQWCFFLTKLLFIKIDKNILIYTRDQGVAYILGVRGFKVCYENHGWFERKTKINLFLLKKVNLIITTNKFIKNKFVGCNYITDKILVAPNGINLDNFNLNLSQESAINKLNLNYLKGKKILLYTGSFKTMGFEKGISDILKALKILNDKNIIFVAVGGSLVDIDYYKNMAHQFSVDGQIYFLPRQTQKNLAIFQKIGNIMLMPFPRIAHYEYFMAPLKMFEYMASDRPIIASDLPSIREILNEENCLFCCPGDFEDLAKKIKQILNNPIFAEKISRQALYDVTQYSWDKRAQKIIEFID